ncbi:MAG: hypothetical protein Q9168_005336 [Polycauliona sp. 1 TL-2023]
MVVRWMSEYISSRQLLHYIALEGIANDTDLPELEWDPDRLEISVNWMAMFDIFLGEEWAFMWESSQQGLEHEIEHSEPVGLVAPSPTLFRPGVELKAIKPFVSTINKTFLKVRRPRYRPEGQRDIPRNQDKARVALLVNVRFALVQKQAPEAGGEEAWWEEEWKEIEVEGEGESGDEWSDGDVTDEDSEED